MLVIADNMYPKSDILLHQIFLFFCMYSFTIVSLLHEFLLVQIDDYRLLCSSDTLGNMRIDLVFRVARDVFLEYSVLPASTQESAQFKISEDAKQRRWEQSQRNYGSRGGSELGAIPKEWFRFSPNLIKCMITVVAPGWMLKDFRENKQVLIFVPHFLSYFTLLVIVVGFSSIS